MLLKRLQSFSHTIWHCLCDPTVQKMSRLLLVITLCLLCWDALADDGTDLLQGTDASAWATLTGTGEKYIYMIEFVVAIAT